VVEKNRLMAARKKSLVESSGRGNPELIFLDRQLGDLHFDDESFSAAEVSYAEASQFALRLFSENYADYSPTPAIVHDLGAAYTRFSECLLHRRSYAAAFEFAKLGRTWSLSDASKDDSYKIYLSEVLGITTSRLGGPGKVVNDYFDRFLNYVDIHMYKLKPLELAYALSDIGDCCFYDGKWSRALRAYLKSRDVWFSLRRQQDPPPRSHNDEIIQRYWESADFGDYNVAVADEKIARVLTKSGRFPDALDRYDMAAKEFQQGGSKYNLEASKMLFLKASLQWQTGDYLKALETRANAVKLWSNSSSKSRR
jgi:tetratricopeptide (TPR) repeat protein